MKINFQVEDFFNFLGISLDNYDTKKLARIINIMHHRSPRVTVFLENPVEEKFKSKSMLANIEFTKTRKGPFIGEMIIAEEVYQYRYPYYLPESILFLSTYNDYYRNHMIKIKLLFIESYSSSVVEKQMPIKAFLNDLQKKDLIDSRFKLILETGKETKLIKLCTFSFTKSDTICFYEKIQSKEIKLN